MSRRRFLLGLSGAGATAASMRLSASAVPTAQGALSSVQLRAEVGSLDLNTLEAIDVHTHPPAEVTPSQSQLEQNRDFVDALLPPGDYTDRDAAKRRLHQESRAHFAHNPRVLQLTEYMARVYGVEPSIEATDALVAKHIGKDFSAYIRSILDRVKIRAILLQSRDLAPVRPASLVPDDRFEWSYSIGPIIQPHWARENQISRIDDLTTAISEILEQCTNNGCRGFKVPVAYYRPLDIKPVDAAVAERDLRKALRLSESGTVADSDAGEYFRALCSYQDYVLKRIYVKAGQLRRAIIIHTAVALHPELRFDFNNPLGLYSVFMDDDIRRAETRFVLIHTGYPYHHHVAAFLSQFPNVYSDLSFYSQYPGTLESTLRGFLALAPSEKIMFGSDGSVAERWGMCVLNVRQALAKILNEYRSNFGWSVVDCERMARNVLSENARRVYEFRT